MNGATDMPAKTKARGIIFKVIITKAIASAQSPIGMNIAILRNMYDIHVRNINCCHVYKGYAPTMEYSRRYSRCTIREGVATYSK